MELAGGAARVAAARRDAKASEALSVAALLRSPQTRSCRKHETLLVVRLLVRPSMCAAEIHAPPHAVGVPQHYLWFLGHAFTRLAILGDLLGRSFPVPTS